jgi:c-di-GMP-binding flagellar brake protein YcgR
MDTPDNGATTRERRKSPRIQVDLDVSLEAGGVLWREKAVDLSQGGVKLALTATSVKLPLGGNVEVRIVLPDRHLEISLTALVWRREDSGVALMFLDAEGEARARLAEFVESRLSVQA